MDWIWYAGVALVSFLVGTAVGQRSGPRTATGGVLARTRDGDRDVATVACGALAPALPRGDVETHVRAVLGALGKIEAIRLHRQLTGMDLKASKEAVEALPPSR